jgi:hypothetical protein
MTFSTKKKSAAKKARLHPTFCEVSQGHSAKNQNLAFSAFFAEMSILGSQEVIIKIGSIPKIELPIGPNRV